MVSLYVLTSTLTPRTDIMTIWSICYSSGTDDFWKNAENTAFGDKDVALGPNLQCLLKV